VQSCEGNKIFKARLKEFGMKAQASVELLMILVALLLVLGVVLEVSGGRLRDAQAYADVKIAQNGIDNIAAAADEAYSDGSGSERTVKLILPSKVVAGRSFVEGNLLGVGIETAEGITDLNARSDAPLQGSLPDAQGEYTVRVRAMEGYVLIGESSLLIKPSLVYTYLDEESEESRNITFTNSGTAPLVVELELEWGNSEVAVGLGTYQLSLQPGESRVMEVDFSSKKRAGTYSGRIEVDASNGEHFEIEVVADVL